MSPFEYVIVLISIILGLGITTILTGLAEWIKHSNRSRLYAPYVIWIVLVFVMHVHEWWVSYGLKSIERWPMSLFMFIVLYPINLYVLAHLLFPVDYKNGPDSKTFYLTNYRKIFISVCIMVVLSMIENMTLLDRSIVEQLPHVLVLSVLVTMILIRTTKTLAHLLLALALLIILLISLALQQKELIISA
ncbi:MAG TPA: hypothetical protein VGK59_19800 [Ohtaekwangia sp.]